VARPLRGIAVRVVARPIVGAGLVDDTRPELPINLLGAWRVYVVGGAVVDSVDAAVESFSEELVAARPALFRLAVTLTSMSEAEDLVQDALTRAWLKREQYRAARGSVRAWALAIVADQASTRRRRRRFPAVHLDDSLPVPSPVDDAVSSAALDLSTAINALPAR
jgi:DNA-directed RNA polymerase specialized sigma24 family protein